MLCGKPIPLDKGYPGERPTFVACGQCLACRINRRRQWATRMMLEERSHSHSSFITLTYETAPIALCDGMPALVLQRKDLTLFFKRWRKKHGKIRYFAVGEYGGKGARPHYHAVMFGLSPTPESEDKVRECWGKGFITISPLEKERILYIAYYTTKKWTKLGTDELYGRPPEFSSQTRRPCGIGGNAIPYLASLYERRDGSVALAERGDVLPTVRIEGKQWPLDNYMLTKLRGYLNVPLLARDRTENKPEYFKDYAQAAKRETLLQVQQNRSHGTL